MAWIESHQTLAEHPKTKRLARSLGVSRPTTIGILHMLWWWAIDYAEDGYLSKYTNEDIADAVMWDGDPDLLIQALQHSGFVDEDMRLHDWDDYIGKLNDRKEKNRERQKKARERKKNANVTSQLNNASVTRTSRTQDDDILVSNQTIPNHTSSSDHDTLGGHGDSDAVEESPQDKPMPLPQKSELTIEQYCQEIEFEMVACGANPNYVAKKEALDWIKKFHVSNVPIEFVKRVIREKFEQNPKIHTFTYCAERVEELWEKELALKSNVEPINFQARLVASRASPETSRYVPAGLPPEVQEWDKFAKRGTS
ncbi:hypothetical protein [Alicyclobacillus fastidiosus]|uniref:Uncharacterized protein n=1 Tax=Alicyclobacillus fastidiosus TaxID=392011 RepID=A0ABV5A9T7_9BACL|nr:hypothetical protein [Alicyclobacillus fastidiosus]WEH10954.1 hypothetical protein PYS47_06985 [Alicyclobacillus fastidiosus]